MPMAPPTSSRLRRHYRRECDGQSCATQTDVIIPKNDFVSVQRHCPFCGHIRSEFYLHELQDPTPRWMQMN